MDEQISAVAALADTLRRSLYALVAASDRPLSRDDVAAAAAVPRSVAAFHLDRLAAEGLLEVEFRRLSGRTGPGAGRPSKLYRRAAGEVSVSLPPRHYQLAAELLASAVEEATETGEPVAPALRRVAREQGSALAASVTPGGRSRRARVDAVKAALAAHGYDPRVGDGEVVLANCPFHALAADHTDLVCGMNLDLLQGFAAALPDDIASARLDPGDGDGCCVRLTLAARDRTHRRERP